MISGGHRLSDIWGYSLRQLSAFNVLVGDVRTGEDKALAILIRYSHHSSDSDFKKFIKQLEV